MIDYTRARIRKFQRREQRKLECLGSLKRKCRTVVDNSNPSALEVFEIVERVEDPLAVAPQVGGRTHAIEEQRILALGVVWIVLMTRGVNCKIWCTALIEFREER